MSKQPFRWFALAAGLAPGAVAMATNTPEIEPNEVKTSATLTAPMVSGDTLSGSTIGGTSAMHDRFRVRVAAGAPGIYRNRLTITSAAAHQALMLGLPQSLAQNDAVVQASVSKADQWYSFGAQHDVFYEVDPAGGTGTMADYTVQFDQTPVTPVDLGEIQPGNVRLTTVSNTTVDTQLFLWDANFNLLRVNDEDASLPGNHQSTINQNLDSGPYYFAVTRIFGSISQQQEGPATEGRSPDFGPNRMDFPGSITRGGGPTNQDVSGAIIDSAGLHPFAATTVGTFDSYFGTFSVAPTPGAMALLGVAGIAGLRRRR